MESIYRESISHRYITVTIRGRVTVIDGVCITITFSADRVCLFIATPAECSYASGLGAPSMGPLRGLKFLV